MADTDYYLWSPVQDGGETKLVPLPTGGERSVVVKRNVVPVGTKVTQTKLGVEDDLWNQWLDGGVVRTYPYPDMPDGSTDSPVVFLQKQLNAAANSEEERLTALVAGATTTEENLVQVNADEANKDKK